MVVTLISNIKCCKNFLNVTVTTWTDIWLCCVCLFLFIVFYICHFFWVSNDIRNGLLYDQSFIFLVFRHVLCSSQTMSASFNNILVWRLWINRCRMFMDRLYRLLSQSYTSTVSNEYIIHYKFMRVSLHRKAEPQGSYLFNLYTINIF